MLTENQNLSIQEALKSDAQRRAFFAQLSKGGGNIGKPGSDYTFDTKRIKMYQVGASHLKDLGTRGSKLRKLVAKSIKKARKKALKDKSKDPMGQSSQTFPRFFGSSKGKTRVFISKNQHGKIKYNARVDFDPRFPATVAKLDRRE